MFVLLISIPVMMKQVTEYDRKTLIRHALAEKYDETEDFFSFPQILASCIFAYVHSLLLNLIKLHNVNLLKYAHKLCSLIQSTSEIAAVVSPYGAIVDIFNHRTKYSGNGEEVVSLINSNQKS